MFTKARFFLAIMLIFLITDVDMIENLAMSGNFVVVTEKFVHFLLSLTKKDHSSIAHRITKKRDLPKIDSV